MKELLCINTHTYTSHTHTTMKKIKINKLQRKIIYCSHIFLATKKIIFCSHIITSNRWSLFSTFFKFSFIIIDYLYECEPTLLSTSTLLSVPTSRKEINHQRPQSFFQQASTTKKPTTEKQPTLYQSPTTFYQSVLSCGSNESPPRSFSATTVCVVVRYFFELQKN